MINAACNSLMINAGNNNRDGKLIYTFYRLYLCDIHKQTQIIQACLFQHKLPQRLYLT